MGLCFTDSRRNYFSYFQNGEEITEEEYNTSLQNYEVPLTTAINWIKI